jgi:glycosyltransferase involved in cell wall biosynthesis
MQKISAIIITCNEEASLARCIESLKPVAEEIIVLDSYSTDNTVRIAKESGAIVYQQNFPGYKEQKNAAIKFTSSDYVLSLDADEVLSVELINSILNEKEAFRFTAYSMNRSNFFCNRFIKHGLWSPDIKIRLFKKDAAYWGGMNPHDIIVLKEKTNKFHLQGEIFHYGNKTEAELKKRNDEISSIAAASLFQVNAGRSRFKIFLSPVWRFLKGYILKFGFLDGYDGFLIAKHTARQAFLKYKKLNRLYAEKNSKSLSVTNTCNQVPV